MNKHIFVCVYCVLSDKYDSKYFLKGFWVQNMTVSVVVCMENVR